MATLSRLAVLSLVVVGLISSGCGGESGGNPAPKDPGDTGSPIVRPGDGGAGGDIGGEGGAGGAGGEGGGVERSVRIDSLRPSRGKASGGEALILKGQGFIDAAGRPEAAYTRVLFGTNPAVGVRVVDDETIHLTTPPGFAGAADVTITNRLGDAVCAECFRYLGPVQLQGIQPAEGSLYGGTQVILSGSGLRPEMQVTFGSRAALDVELLEDGSLSMLTPPGNEEELVDIRIFDQDGQSWLRKGFQYVAPLRVEAVEPPGGPIAGGNSVRIHGAGFTSSSQVFFGETPVRTVVESPGLLSVTAPASSTIGLEELIVETHAESTTASYAYYDPASDEPRIYGISPQRGPLAGGTEVTLVGTGLDHGLLAVWFGGTLAPDTILQDGHLVRVKTPQGSMPGAVDVEARVVRGADELPGGFVYLESMSIEDVSPATGPGAGGTAISVTGANFPEEARLFVGALEASDVVRVSPNLITGITPRGTAGPVPVRVVGAGGDDEAAVLADGFTYDGELELSVVEPATGSRAGGTRVTLRGKGFYDGMPVAFGPAQSAQIEVVDPFTAIVITPRGNVGTFDVRAGSVAGPNSTLPQAFTYTNPSSSSGGSSGGPLNGTINVTVLNGSYEEFGHPLEGARVIVGSDDGTEIQGVTDDRGQATLSSPLLVKPQVVTVSLAGFESATIVDQRSENLTVILEPNVGEPVTPSPGPPPPPGIVKGKVWGFKKPPNRALKPSEVEMALVYVSYPNIYQAPPSSGEQEGFEITEEGGEFIFGFGRDRRLAIYAVYGIMDEQNGIFEPILMGVSRGVNVVVPETTEVDIILDMRLDMEVPVDILNAPPEGATTYAYIDLGAEGVIPVGSVRTSGAKGVLRRLPGLSGESFIFQTWANAPSNFSFSRSVTFRRQAGDLRQGLTVGPMMGIINGIQPQLRPFSGQIEWTITPGPAAEIAMVDIFIPGMAGPISFWHIVLPGTERRVSLPPSAVSALKARFSPGELIYMNILLAREPRFAYDQWTYGDMSLDAFTSYTFFQQLIQL